MTIQGINMGDYDEVDRRFNSKLVEMYRYMVHVKPYVLAALLESKDKSVCGKLLTVYANLCMTFGEFRSMTFAHMPNLSFKRKFYDDTVNLFGDLIGEYHKLVQADNLVLTEAEKKINL